MPEIQTNAGVVITMLDADETADTVSDYFHREEYLWNTIQVFDGGVSVDVDVQVSNDATNWVKLGSTLSSPAITSIQGLYKYIRVVRDSSTNSVSATCVSGSKFSK